MPEVLVDIDEKDLDEIAKVAVEEHRSRRAQITKIIEEYVHRRLGEKKN